MKRIRKYYRGETDHILYDKDWRYIDANPELESFLHNVYKTSKLPNKRITASISSLEDTNNMPEGADPKAKINVVPDSVNNYKGLIGIEDFKMLPKLQLRQQYYDLWAAYVKKYVPRYWGKFKKTMEGLGYRYNLDNGTYSKPGESYRIHNGTLLVWTKDEPKWVDTEFDWS